MLRCEPGQRYLALHRQIHAPHHVNLPVLLTTLLPRLPLSKRMLSLTRSFLRIRHRTFQFALQPLQLLHFALCPAQITFQHVYLRTILGGLLPRTSDFKFSLVLPVLGVSDTSVGFPGCGLRSLGTPFSLVGSPSLILQSLARCPQECFQMVRLAFLLGKDESEDA